MTDEQIPRGKRLPTAYLFMINGIAALLGYNALLTALDYFNYVYTGYGVYSLFLPPVFLGYVLMAISFKFISEKYSYKTLIVFGILLCNAALIILLLSSLITDGAKGFGFAISLFACFLLGVGANSFQLTIFAMINYLSESAVSKNTIGTALSGLGITSLRMIIVLFAGTDNSNSTPIIIYFIIAILFNFLTLFSNLSFLKSRQFKIKILPYIPGNKQQQSTQTSLSLKLNPSTNSSISEKQTVKISEKQTVKDSQQSYFKLLYLTSKQIFPYPWMIFSNYIITFLVFPNLTINKKYQEIDFVWSCLFFFFAYNLGDTMGKVICGYRNTFNSFSLIYLFGARAYFLVTIPLIATTLFDQDILINNYFYPYLLQFLFSLTNGIVTNGCFIQSFQVCPLKYKKYAGVLGGIMLQIGILFGSNLAIPYSSLFVSDS